MMILETLCNISGWYLKEELVFKQRIGYAFIKDGR